MLFTCRILLERKYMAQKEVYGPCDRMMVSKAVWDYQEHVFSPKSIYVFFGVKARKASSQLCVSLTDYFNTIG